MTATRESNNETIPVTSSIFPYDDYARPGDDHPVIKCSSTLESNTQAATSKTKENKNQVFRKNNCTNMSHLRKKTTCEKTFTFENAESTLASRERDLQLDSEIKKRRQKTSTRTRKRLMKLEVKLEENKQKTHSYTRERLAEVERMHAQCKLKRSYRKIGFG